MLAGFMPTIAPSRQAALQRRRFLDEVVDLNQRVRYLGAMIGLPLGLVGCGHGHVGMVLVRELVDCGQDDIGAVRVDEVDEGLEVAACRIAGRIVPYFAPGGEEDEFGVAGAASFLEVASRERQRGECVPAASQGDAASLGEEAHDFGHGADVGAAQHCIRVGHVSDLGGDGLAPGQADGCLREFEPAVGLFGEQRAEAERAGQSE